MFDERDQAAIAWADLVTRNEAHADPSALERVRRSFSEPEVVELTLAASLFNFLNRFNDTMWLELDGGAPPSTQLHVEPEAFARYAASMFETGGG